MILLKIEGTMGLAYSHLLKITVTDLKFEKNKNKKKKKTNSGWKTYIYVIHCLRIKRNYNKNY